jgi:hypothetical protein
MDFTKFDMRAKAEVGSPLHLKDPQTGEPIFDGKKPCIVIVRGVASRSAQEAQRARQKARMAASKGKKGDDEARVMEDIHNELCDTAASFILGFENIEHGDRPLTAEPEDIKRFLDLSFPVMGVKRDEAGDPVLKDGEPQFEMRNNPFAKQIAEFASEQADALGNG